MMDDNSIMPFGKYKGEELINVPADYLIHLYEDNLRDGDLRDYIEDNMDVLREQVKRSKYVKRS